MEAKAIKKNSPVAGTSVVVIIALAVLVGFYLLNNKVDRSKESAATISAVKELLLMDLDSNYPKTPKEVVKTYSEITRVFYSEDFTDTELKKLANMSRQLFDDELRANQTDESYLRALRGEIASYKQENRVISSYSVASSADVQYYTFEGAEWAQLVVMYSIRTGVKIEPTKERFLLRKDAGGHWKIYGFRVEPLEQAAGDQ